MTLSTVPWEKDCIHCYCVGIVGVAAGKEGPQHAEPSQLFRDTDHILPVQFLSMHCAKLDDLEANEEQGAR